MTPQEIVIEYRKLPPEQQREVRESLESNEPDQAVSYREVLERLHAKGIIGNVPDPDAFDEDDDFEPIEVAGESLSEMIMRERR